MINNENREKKGKSQGENEGAHKGHISPVFEKFVSSFDIHPETS